MRAHMASLQLPNGVHHRWIPEAEAERLRRRGDCTRLRRSGAQSIGRTVPVYRLVQHAAASEADPTPSSLTFADMIANAGLASKRRVVLARRKVREFGVLRVVAVVPNGAR